MILYYDNPHTARVREQRTRVVPVKFRWVMISELHVSKLSGHIYEQRTLFMILECFGLLIVNKVVDQFIRS